MSHVYNAVMSATSAASGTCKPHNFSADVVTTGIWGWQGWYLLADLFILFVVLFKNWVPIEFAMVAAVMMLGAAQIITIAEMAAGFGNPAILAIANLLIVAEGLSSTGAIDYFMAKFLGQPKTLGGALLRMMMPSMFVAMWISSTAVVALLIPVLQRWSKLIKQPPSLLLMPLTFAVHLGGTVTLIGTTTNLVIAGVASSYYCRSFGIFDITPVGLPVAISGVAFLILFTRFLLPDANEYRRRTDVNYGMSKRTKTGTCTLVARKLRACCCCCFRRYPMHELSRSSGRMLRRTRTNGDRNGGADGGDASSESHPNNNENGGNGGAASERDNLLVIEGEEDDAEQATYAIQRAEFVLHARIPPEGSELLANKSVLDAGLRSLQGLFLVSVQRGNTQYSAVGPEFVLLAGDILSFAGLAEDFLNFCTSKGLIPLSVDADAEEFSVVNAEATPVVALDGIPSIEPLSSQQQGGVTNASGTAASTSAMSGGGTPSTHSYTTSSPINPLSTFMTEAIVRSGSMLEGKTMKETNFRTRYNASAIGIHREGEKLRNPRMGQIPLKVGDVMVLVTNENFDWNAPETKRDLKPRVDGERRGKLDSMMTGDDDYTSMDLESVDSRKMDLGERDYVFSMRVKPSSPLLLVQSLVGKTIEHGGLRDVSGARVVALQRGNRVERAVGPECVMQAGDVIFFAGDRESLANIRRIPGLEDADAKQVSRLNLTPQSRRLVEVVLSLRSDMLYKTVRETRFRTRFSAAIVAVQRQGGRVLSKIGDIVLQPGDILILDAGPDFTKRFKDDKNFLIISEVPDSAPPRMDRFYICVALVIAMVVCAAATGIEILLFALFAVGIMLATGVLTRERAHAAVDWPIIITVASAYGLSAAMTNTKVADVVGRALTSLAISTGTGQLGVLTVVMIFTEILAALITAKAGALVMFPIAASAAFRLNIDTTQMLIALMLGSSDFTTPQGHPTNLMVMNPGAYFFVDYQMLGIPFEIYLNVIQVVCLWYMNFAYITIPGSIVLLVTAVCADHLCVERKPLRSLFIVKLVTCRVCRGKRKNGGGDDDDANDRVCATLPSPMLADDHNGHEEVNGGGLTSAIGSRSSNSRGKSLSVNEDEDDGDDDSPSAATATTTTTNEAGAVTMPSGDVVARV